MSIPTESNIDYEPFDSDDLVAPSPLQFLDLPDPDQESLLLEDAPKGALSPVTFCMPSPNAFSPDSATDSFQDSCSDSASENRAASSASSKGSTGDIAMTDGPTLKAEWPMTDFIRDDDSSQNPFTFGLDDSALQPPTLDPSTLNFNDNWMDKDFDFESASSSPTPLNNAKPSNNDVVSGPAIPALGITQTSTHTSTAAQTPQPLSQVNMLHTRRAPNQRRTAVPVSKQKRHQKAHSQYSLSQSMSGLTTGSSREVSPIQNAQPSQEPSPAAMLPNSAAAAHNMELVNASSAMWQTPFDISTMVSMHQFSPGMPQPSPHDVSQFANLPHFPMFSPFPIDLPDHCKLYIHPTPFKSRVETQIPIKMSLFPLPRGIKRLHLPTHTISKPKLLARPSPEKSPDMLELSTMLVCTSAMSNEENRKRALAKAAALGNNLPPSVDSNEENDEDKPQNGGEVQICAGCITRERKRAARKKIKKVEEEELWNRDEARRVIVFNTQEIKEWQATTSTMTETTLMGGTPESSIPPGSFYVECPMRIACYCRHQNEKIGFQVIFTIKDCQDRIIAQEMSSSIMITDDHKTHPGQGVPGHSPSHPETNVSGSTTVNSFSSTHKSPMVSQLKQAPPSPYTPISGTGTSTKPAVAPAPRNLSRSASPGASSGPSAKKRKASGSVKLPMNLAMTPRTAPPVTTPQPTVGQTSPFSPSLPAFPVSDHVYPTQGNVAARIHQAPLATGPPTPNSNHNENVFFSSARGSSSMDTMSMPQLYSAPTSAHPSRAPSPNGLRNGSHSTVQAQLAQAIANGVLNLPVNFDASQQPTIHKIIPNEGPKSGGIEVTILGSGFTQGLDVMFGDQRATTTTFWGASSLVCLLPPSRIAGPVIVTVKQQVNPVQQYSALTKQQTVFTYIDDDEQQLIRSALAVLGQKMTGKMEDARELARRILGDGSAWGGSGGSGSGTHHSNGSGFSTLSLIAATECHLLKVLELIDLDDSTHRCRWNLRSSSGQTMLHLACAMGLHRLVAGLLSRGANPEARDKGGFTPMHLASMNGHVEIVRRLVSASADPTMRSLSGLTAADMAPSGIARSIRRIERFARSRRCGSLHSRANSATSLRSLWEGPSASPTESPDEYSDDQDPNPGYDESPEYSSFWESQEEAVEDDEMEDTNHGQIIGFSLRRASHRMDSTSQAPPTLLQAHKASGDEGSFPSPTATIAAWREQFAAHYHQWKPTLQDYQTLAFLQEGMRRFMPSLGRPGSSGTQGPSSAVDNTWWDSLFPSSAPPAYEDLYPQSAIDNKQVSAAQAAAEAEADLKCATLYDQEPPDVSAASSSQTLQKKQLPALLQIGRRHAITQEQRENLQQLHSEKLVRCSNDRNLFFIWIPLLVAIVCVFLHNQFPFLFPISTSFLFRAFTDKAATVVSNTDANFIGQCTATQQGIGHT